jgi:hypothetical protein
MPKMVVTHAVVNLERWLDGKAERAGQIGQWATNVTDYARLTAASPPVSTTWPDYGGHDLSLARRHGRGGAPRRDPPDHRLHREVVGHDCPRTLQRVTARIVVVAGTAVENECPRVPFGAHELE